YLQERPGDGTAARSSEERKKAFLTRAFGDGGYLDNKPFGYATDALARRRADFPVRRKLLYIEPAPEHPERVRGPSDVDGIENVPAALLTLPRYETIREDLQRVLERNQLVERAAHITSGVERDLKARYGKRLPRPLTRAQWAKLSLRRMVKWKGL